MDAGKMPETVRAPSVQDQARTQAAPAGKPLFYDEGGGYDLFGLNLRALERAAIVGRPLYQRYFRVASHGIEHIPAAGPAILVANHGGVLPVDGTMLCLDVLFRSQPPRIPRAVVDRFVPLLPFVGTSMARIGAVTGTRANVRRLLERGELLVIWPEGTTGVAKPFQKRYRLQEWRVGHAELAIRHRAPVVPVAILGAEESWPLLARIRGSHLFGAPYLPVPAIPFPLPTHYQIHYGAPLLLHRDYPPEAADDPGALDEAALRVRRALQGLLRQALARRKGLFR
jgi:1-acyl-sn-glycerol-3-phosphate acyltransferase